MSQIKLSDLITKFDGSEDAAEWLDKLELICSLQEIKNLSSFVPLFLVGGAYSVYKSLSVDVKEDYAKLKQALLEAFSVDKFMAYEQFSRRKLEPGEQVDVFAADLKRLAALISKAQQEQFVLCAFIQGLPTDVSARLRAGCCLADLSLEQLVEKARAIIKTEGQQCFAAIDKAVGVKSVTCYKCLKVGHLSRNCRMLTNAQSKRACFVCGEEDHLANSCPKRHQPKNA